MKNRFFNILLPVLLVFLTLIFIVQGVQAQDSKQSEVGLKELYAYMQNLDSKMQQVLDNQEQMFEEFKRLRYYTRRS